MLRSPVDRYLVLGLPYVYIYGEVVTQIKVGDFGY